MFSCTKLAVFWLARLIKMRADPTPNNVDEMSCSMFVFQEMQTQSPLFQCGRFNLITNNMLKLYSRVKSYEVLLISVYN